MNAMTREDAIHHVITTEPTFEVTTATVRGVEYKVFKNIPQTVRELLQASRAAQDEGRAEYLVFADERWTYDAFCHDIKSMANALQVELGVGKGDRVALAMRNCPEMLILFGAIASLGAVTVFLNGWWTTEELAYGLEDSGATLVFADGDRLKRLEPLLAEKPIKAIGVRDGIDLTDRSYPELLAAHQTDNWPDSALDTDDDLAVMYSSGTTGQPKGVVLTHRGAVNAVFTWLMQGVLAPLIDPPDPDAPEPPRLSALILTPLFHVTATHPVFLASLPAGAKLCLMHTKWDPETAVRIIRDEEVRRVIGVPTQSHDLMVAAQAMGEPLPSLEVLGAGGAKRPAAQVAALAKAFPNAQPGTGWGMTETSGNGFGFVGQEYQERPSCSGRLYPPLQEIRFLDDKGDEVPVGEIGEITVKSPCIMRCYLNKPDATAAVLKDGWLSTGDLGFIEADGMITVVDRKKDIIIRGGENIACLDVEGAIHKHPAVAEACVFSVPHDRLGEVVGAGVLLRDGATLSAEDLRAYLGDHIARFKIPEHIWFRDAPLPRGTTDKLDRRALRADYLKTFNLEET